MVDIKKLHDMTSEDLGKIQAVIDLFALLGVSEADLANLPEVLANWGKVKDNLNAMVVDVSNLKADVAHLVANGGKSSKDTETPENLQQSVGFGSATERVLFRGGNDL